MNSVSYFSFFHPVEAFSRAMSYLVSCKHNFQHSEQGSVKNQKLKLGLTQFSTQTSRATFHFSTTRLISRASSNTMSGIQGMKFLTVNFQYNEYEFFGIILNFICIFCRFGKFGQKFDWMLACIWLLTLLSLVQRWIENAVKRQRQKYSLGGSE